MIKQQPPYFQALLASGSVFLLYVLTLAPTTAFWDASEYIATAHIFGLPHPPGNPLFVAVGKVWTLLLAPTNLPISVRVNLMAALTSAVATGFLFLVTYRVLARWIAPARGGVRSEDPGPWIRRFPVLGAWVGALLGSTAFTVWNQSTVNEKVYTPSVLVIALVSWLTIRWLDRKDEPGMGWILVLAIYLMVLGSTNHLMSLLPAPALLAVVLLEKKSLLLDGRFLSRSLAAVLLGLSFNLVLPIRSAQQPVINEGEPICESVVSTAVAVYSLGMAGCPELAANLTREQYGKPSMLADPTADPSSPRPRGLGILTHQFLNYFQYFDWQWARGLAVSELPGNARLPFSLVFLGLGFWGLVVSGRAHRGYLVYLGILAFTLTVALVYYLNFKYGYSLQPNLGDVVPREVRERDYFFIASFHLWGFLAGIGLMAAWRWAAGGGFTGRNLALASPVVLLALVPLVFNWDWASRRGDYAARDWAYNMLQSVEPYGILFTNGDNDTFPLWYLQEVEEVRQDVTVVVVQYLMTQWYPRQLKYHTAPERQRLFDDPEAAEIYGSPGPPPSRAMMTLSDADMDRVAFAILPEDYTVTIGNQPVRFPAGFQFTRADQLTLAIIQDSIGERPIHFASTGSQARTVGLDQFVVRQGLAAKLRLENLEGAAGVVRLSDAVGGEWLDFDRSMALASEVFMYRGLRDREIWADRATLNIPWHFYFLYLQMADAVSLTREAEELSGAEEALFEELLGEANRFLLVAQGGSRASI